jgi:CHAT domain-containing protein/tetratricopeptide (TPR) repeat protein
MVEGETVRKEIVGGEPQSVGVTLAAGQYARLLFLWRGVDLEVSVFKPGGERLSALTQQVKAPGNVPVSILAEGAGEYKVEVRPRERLKIDAAFEARLSAVRQPTAADEARVAAERALAEAAQLRGAEAEEKAGKALQLWRGAEDAEGEATALHALGELHALSKKLVEAEKDYVEEQALRRKIGDAASEAHALLALGDAHRRINSPEDSLPYYQRALELFRGAGDRTGESLALYNIGFALASARRYREALQPYSDALAIQSADGDLLRESRTLNALGGVYNALGDYDLALTYYQRAAPARQRVGDRLGEALITGNNIGVLYDNVGEWQRAKESYEAALSTYESLPAGGLKACAASDTAAQSARVCAYAAAALNNLGELHNTLGDPQTALSKFDQSLAISMALGDAGIRDDTYSHMCYSQLLLGRAADAVRLCERVISVTAPPPSATPTPKSTTDPSVLAYTYIAAGMAYDALGDGAKATDYFLRAHEIHAQSGDARGQALALEKAGESLARRRDAGGALEKFEQALSLWRQIKDEDGVALTLYNIALVERDRDNLAGAHAQITAALDIVESLRVKVTAQRLRASYFAQKSDYYELAVDLKMRLAKAGGLSFATPAELVASALQTSERARARVLFDILTEAHAEPRDGSDRVLNELLQRYGALQQQLSRKAALQTDLLVRKAAAEKEKEKATAEKRLASIENELASVEKELSQLAAEYDDVDAQLRERNPRYAGLTRPQPLSVAEIQSQLLDDQTILLEYALGGQRSYLWVVARSGIKTFELRGREEIEESARRVRDILRAEQKQTGESALAYQTRLAGLEVQFREESGRLSGMLLGPAAAELGRKRLLIVAGGELQQIPFAALPTAEAAAVGDRPRMLKASARTAENEAPPLGEEHEIVSLPSASTLAALRAETNRRQRPPKVVAILADPVFDKEDERLKKILKGQSPLALPPSLSQALSDVARSFGMNLPRLLSSKREADDIKATAPPGMATESLGFEASWTTATAPQLGQYRIVHFATHGIFNDRQPELSGVVLSLYDERGRPREDGFLRLHDIYNLSLPVDMVVLSACQTGLGKQVRGEGLIGLTRGFMYAGAARVVASLWKVDDEATAELMKLFYQYMLRDGMSPPAALRQAQASVRAQRRWRAPYYWAGFVLQGEWK